MKPGDFFVSATGDMAGSFSIVCPGCGEVPQHMRHIYITIEDLMDLAALHIQERHPDDN